MKLEFVRAPRIETARLILRAHGAADLDAVAAMWSDAALVRHITGKPSTREESWARILRYAGLWPTKGYGYWAVEDKATGRFAGDIGLADFARDIAPAMDMAPEAGWVLAPWAHGKGYATEAVLATLAWADANLTGLRAHCMLDVENVASVRVAQKCGFKEFARATYKGQPALIYRR